MAKRKYARLKEEFLKSECSNKKCKWIGDDKDKVFFPISPVESELQCPECGNNEFYGILESYLNQKRNMKYKQPNTLNAVAEFHRTFNAPILEVPTIPSSDRCELRVDLLQEELDELKEAIYKKDLVEIADALCDLNYVLMGAVLEFGLAEKFNDLFAEVQRSNISKVCGSYTIANDTILDYAKKRIIVYKEEIGDGKYLVKRKSDDKILKSIDYSPANLKPIINK